ncbi:MaoC family dehydratase [Alkanindiges sp. WGS2144]|uniref:MaoC family dehydratase n=1 Tax=Alkanindiges sp. WGS2144 TaxID=3366808 RepID=UPI0037533CD7
MLYLDDLNIGDRFSSPGYTLEKEKLLDFASEYDPQPFHLDDELAKNTLFNGLAASGWQTASITMKLWLQTLKVANGLIGIEGHLKWPTPTRPGDTLHVEAEIVDIKVSKSKPNMGIVTYHSLTKNQHDQVVQDTTCKIVVFKKTNPDENAH